MQKRDGEALPNDRRTMLKALPLLPLAAALPAPAAARPLSARDRMDFHLAEYKKAVEELSGQTVDWTVERTGPDAHGRLFFLVWGASR